ncbi:MAG: ABC transporter ATP-binding protein [Clostridium sp.]|jgi:iron complex transport system ATP-binding protein|nr:ABC transporter ATP-binding protein [Clostridium sp.]
MPRKELKMDIGYQNHILYEDVRIAVPENGIVSILGDNGSGKSTLYKTLLGIIPPVKGEVPKDLAGQIAVVSDYVHLPEEVTVRDILCLLGPEKVSAAEKNHSDLHSYIMQYQTQGIATLSSGQRRIVEIYAVLASGKKVIVLDEATNSLDVSNRQLFLTYVKKLSEGNILFFHTSHEIHDAVFLGGTVYALFPSARAVRQFTGELTGDSLYRFLGYGVKA